MLIRFHNGLQFHTPDEVYLLISRAIDTVMVVDRKTTYFIPNLLCLWCDLLFNRLEDMESDKWPAEEALDESVPPHQRLHHRRMQPMTLGG